MLRALNLAKLESALCLNRKTIMRITKRTDPKRRLHRLNEYRVLVAESELERWLRDNTQRTA